jgi:hypothetical protein
VVLRYVEGRAGGGLSLCAHEARMLCFFLFASLAASRADV